MQKVCVYCASSRSAHPDYYTAARRMGELLAAEGITIVYGGGGHGSMGALADGALGAGGKVVGVMPNFMSELEWCHRGLTELHLVDNMRERKHRMMQDVDAVVALPGGCGTLEELFEAITLKRLGLFCAPIVLLNTRNFYDDCDRLLRRCVEERFMSDRHLDMWTLAAQPEDVLPTLRACPQWDQSAQSFAIS